MATLALTFVHTQYHNIPFYAYHLSQMRQTNGAKRSIVHDTSLIYGAIQKNLALHLHFTNERCQVWSVSKKDKTRITHVVRQ